ncbi:MAG: hypothetical protein K2P81_16635, partial [Bacteriovoracaceae bacterium]|nr:hypothetical protein [Bacteriovoracaceae bacterium]
EIRLGPFGNLTTTVGSQSQSVDVRTTSLLVGWEFPAKNFFGEWAWGLSYQRDFPKLRNQRVYIAQNSNTSFIDSFSLHLSQGFDW